MNDHKLPIQLFSHYRSTNVLFEIGHFLYIDFTWSSEALYYMYKIYSQRPLGHFIILVTQIVNCHPIFIGYENH